MDRLTDYQHRRLDLADALREALYLARAHQDEIAEHQLRGLLRRLADDRLTVGVVGQFSRGKSTLMNALLGGEYLPMGVLPVTAVVTTIRYGSRARATFRRRGGTIDVEVPLTELADVVSASGARRAEMQVVEVTIELPADLLRAGFSFVDTPGVGSHLDSNTAVTRRFLPEADAVLFVTAFDSALTDAETSVLAAAAASAGAIYVVVNKRDLVDDTSAEEVERYVRQVVRRVTGERDVPVIPLSALTGLRGAREGRLELLAGSGVLGFRERLVELLTIGKSRALVEGIARRAVDLVQQQQRDLRLGTMPPADAEALVARFDARVAETEERGRAQVSALRGGLDVALRDEVERRRESWTAELAAALPDAVAVASGEVEASPDEMPDWIGRAQRAFEAAAAPVVEEWLGRKAAEVTDVAIGLTGDRIGELRRLASSIGPMGAELAGARLPQDDADGGWSPEDLPAFAAPVVTASLPIAPGHGLGVTASARTAARLRAIRAAQETLPASLVAAAADRLVSWSSRWADELGSAAAKDTALAAERFRRAVLTAPDEEDLTAIGSIADRLAAFRRETAGADDFAHAASPAGDGAPRPERELETREHPECPVCRDVRTALVEFVSRAQLGLATRERDQRAHAEGGGYCPLHTWTYYAVASPLGVSSAYAPLVSAVADRLEALAAGDGPGASAGDSASETTGVGADGSDTGGPASGAVARTALGARCPVCEMLEARTSRLVAEIARGEAPAPALCVPHLGRVLDQRPDRARAQELCEALARTLRRDAEDMRSFALKREALRRGSLSDEEGRAHLGALLLLAGDPLLSRPAQRDRNSGAAE